MKKKFLLFGAQGMLGAEIFHSSEEHPEIEVIPFSRFNADVTVPEQVFDAVNKFEIDGVINATAFTAVDKCEDERWEQMAYEVNALGPKYLTEACRKKNIPLYHFSTDYVFSGMKGDLFDERSPKNPINAYGKMKSEGEDFVLEYENGYVLRTSWLSGEYGPNFVHQMVHFSKTRKSIDVVEEYGSPSFCEDVVQALFQFVLNDEKPKENIFHLANEGECSRRELVQEIQSFLQLHTEIHDRDDFGLLANRPVSSVLKNTLLPLLPSWKDGLHRFLKGELEKLEKAREVTRKKNRS